MENNPAEQLTQPIQPVTPTPVQPPPPIEPVKQNFLSSKWLKIGIVVLVLILVLGGTFVLSGKLINKPAPTPTPVAVATPTPADETASWKTYNGNGYSFKYPSSYKIQLIDSDNIKILDSNASDSAFLQIEKLQPMQASNYLGLPTIGNDLINGNNWNIVSGKFCDVYLCQTPYIYQVMNGGARYSFQFGDRQTSLTTIQSQILSTFKFTTDKTVTMNTYTNSQFGFSFNYPTDWKITTAFDPSTPYLKLNLGLIQSNRERSSSTVTPIYVMQYDNPNNLSVSDWQTAYNKNLPSQHEFYSSSDIPTTIADLKAYVNPKAGCEPLLCYQTIVMAKNNVFIFYNVNLDSMVAGENFATNQKIYDGIISSLKFTQ